MRNIGEEFKGDLGVVFWGIIEWPKHVEEKIKEKIEKVARIRIKLDEVFFN